MPVMLNLSKLALRQLIDGACRAIGYMAGETAVDTVTRFLTDRFMDQSLRLSNVLERSNDNAWRALEVALAGESFWNWLDRAEDKAFRQQVRTFLDATPLGGLSGHGPEFRQVCLRELKAARKGSLLTGGSLNPVELAREAGAFARFADPHALLQAEWNTLDGIAEELRQAQYSTLAHLVALRPGQGDSMPLLVIAVRFFFRREVESDRELYRGLTWAKLELIQQTQEQAFTALASALAANREQLLARLDDLNVVVVETHGAVLDIQQEQQRQGQQLIDMYQAVLELKRRHDLQAAELRPRDSMAIGNEQERRLVKQLLERFRGLPADQQKRLPALLNSLAQLEVATGDFDRAQKDFQEVAGLVGDRVAQAEAQHNAYAAALERADWAGALMALQEAARLAPARFAPFPLGKYEPERILGAGGFGVAFLCRNRHSGSRVVVKTLRLDSLERQVSDVFREARLLEELEHPAIIRLRDCDFADAEQTRPYLVMDYFEGVTLAEHLEQHGALTVPDLLAVARPVAEALQAAHERGILHRDVKPANLLVRREPPHPLPLSPGGRGVRGEGAGWRVRLIDFGLALKQSVLNTTAAASAGSRTTLGYSIAGTLEYAAPEQMGRLPGVAVGPYTDVYGFGKLCCYALFRTVQPLRKHWREVPEPLADLLEHCLNETPKERLPSFAAVLQRLGALSKPAPPPSPPPPAKVAPAPPAPSRQREWWRLPAGQQTGGAGELRRLQGHTDAVLAVAFSPDGKRLLSCGGDATVRLWDVESGQELYRLEGHTDKVWSGAVAPDGKWAISSGKDKTVRMWDLERGKELHCFLGRTNRSVALSHDGQLAISGSLSDGMVRLWEVETGRELRRFKGHMSWVLSLAFTSDDLQAVTGSADGTVRLWDVTSGREVRRLQGHKDQVLSVALSVNDGHVLSGSADRTVRLWDLNNGRQVLCFQDNADQVWSVAVSPDSRHALWEGPDWSVALWDLATGKEVQRYRGHGGKVMSVAFSPDGRLAAAGSMDKTICLWDVDI